MTALVADSLVPLLPASPPAAAGSALPVSSQVDDPRAPKLKLRADGTAEKAAGIILADSLMKRVVVRRHGWQ